MRVIYCPNCQELLPGIAIFCARCGEHLPISAQVFDMLDEDLIAPTIEISHRPSALKVTRFSALNNSTQDTGPCLTATVQQSGCNNQVSFNQILPATQLSLIEQDVIGDELQSRANWEKIVTHKTSRVTPDTSNPLVVPGVYKPLVSTTPPVLISVQRVTTQKSPRLSPRFVSWISILVLLCLLLGGVFGLAVSYGRGFLDRSSHTGHVFALKVTPLNAAVGGILTLHGTAFSSNGNIGLTRDANITLIDTGGMNIIRADSQGSFSDTLIVDASWGVGSHIIHAEDAMLHKSASFTVFVTGQGISLRPSHLLFSPHAIDLGAGDQAMNTTQTVTLSNTGGGQINWRATTTQSWLFISPKSGTLAFNQKMKVEVAADRSNLKVGAYAVGLVFLANSGQATLPVKMLVTQLQPGHRAVLQLNPGLLSFTATDGVANPQSQVVTVSNPGVLPLQWSVTSETSDGSSWLSMYPLSGTVARGSSQPVTISVNTSIMLPGVYTGSLTFTSQGEVAAKDSPQTIFVSLVITPQCSIQISPGGLNFASAYLQQSPAGQVISLATSQGCSASLSWSTSVTTSSGGNWLSIGPARGGTPANPVVTVNSTGLNPGTYSGSIIFNWPAGTQSLPVTLTVSQAAKPIMAVAPSTITWSGNMGQTVPLTQTVTITNSGGGSMVWHASAVTTVGGAWLAISSNSGTVSPHSTNLITVSGTIFGSLTAGTYTGSVTITAIDSVTKLAVGNSIVIPVTLTLQQLCTLLPPSSSAMTFSAQAGLNPAPQTFSVGVVGACTGNVTITPTATSSSGTGWLAVSAPMRVTSGGSATFTVTTASTGLAGGKYTGSISLAALNGSVPISGSPEVVGITLNVIAAASLTAGPGSLAFNVNVSSGIVSQPITITNSGGSTLNWIAALGAGAPGYVSLSAASGKNLAGGQTTSINVIVDATGLARGTSVTTSVIVSAINPLTGQTVSGSPATITVTINSPPPQMVLSVISLTFTTTANTDPAPQTVNVQNPGGNTLTWTVGTPSQPWLVASTTTDSDAAGQAALITFNVNVTGLAAGTYNATVIITPSVGIPLTVNVTLTIN